MATTIMTNKQTNTLSPSRPFTMKELKQFIHSFDFANPVIPSGSEALWAGGSHPDLSKYEQGILTGIRLAWYTTGAGKKYLLQKTSQIGFTVVSILIVGAIARGVVTSPIGVAVKEVGAATVSASLRSITAITGTRPDGIIESTMSAALRAASQSNAEIYAD